MAGSPRPLQVFYRLYFGFWIPALVWASTRWPLRLMYWMARWLVIVPFAFARPKYMRAVRGNYARILGLPPSHRQVRRAAWQMMFEHAYHWIDFFRWSQQPEWRLDAAVACVEGVEHFRAARASGRGTLLLTAHMGNPEVGAVALGKTKEPVTLLYWRDRFATAEEFRTRMRTLGRVHGIPVDAEKVGYQLRLAVFQNLELLGLQIVHGLTVLSGNRDLDVDDADLDARNEAALGLRLRQQRASEQHYGRKKESLSHYHLESLCYSTPVGRGRLHG